MSSNLERALIDYHFGQFLTCKGNFRIRSIHFALGDKKPLYKKMNLLDFWLSFTFWSFHGDREASGYPSKRFFKFILSLWLSFSEDQKKSKIKKGVICAATIVLSDTHQTTDR